MKDKLSLGGAKVKQFLLITGVLLAWTSCVTAADKVTMSADDYKSMMRRMDAMQKQVNSLGAGTSSRKRGGSARTQAVETKYDRLAQDVSGIYDTLDVVETKALQDRINFGAELRARMDNWRVKDFPVAGDDQTRDNFWSTRFRLNMNADIRRGLSFHGRFAVYKAWADSTASQLTNDANRAHALTDTTLKLDRAYVDWVPQGFPLPLAITFGRQPSSEGPPFEYKENRKRQSTYPALLFGGESDGIVATFGMERYIKMRNSGLRFFYAKGFQSDEESTSFPNFLNDVVNPNGVDDTNVYAVFFEGEIPKLRNSLVVLSYIRANDFNDNGANSLVGSPTVIGDMDLAGFHMQFNNIKNSGLDFFYSYGWNKAHPNGNPAAFGFGLLTGATNTTENDGDAHYVGFRYTIPVKAMKNPKIGYEFNTGSQYWFSFTLGAAELYNKLATRGDVHDIYYIQPFNRNLFLRTGYTIIDYDYNGTGFHIGNLGTSDAKLRNFYLILDCRF